MNLSLEPSQVLLWVNIVFIILITSGMLCFVWRERKQTQKLIKSNITLHASVQELAEILSKLVVNRDDDKVKGIKID